MPAVELEGTFLSSPSAWIWSPALMMMSPPCSSAERAALCACSVGGRVWCWCWTVPQKLQEHRRSLGAQCLPDRATWHWRKRGMKAREENKRWEEVLGRGNGWILNTLTLKQNVTSSPTPPPLSRPPPSPHLTLFSGF